jgi:hypothetical protein
MNTHATIQELPFLCNGEVNTPLQQWLNCWKTVFSVPPPRKYITRISGSWDNWNTSIVTLGVVGGDEKGSLKSETVKYGHDSQGTRTRERLRWREPAEYTKDRPVLSLEGAPEKQDRNWQRVINIWSWAPDEARHQHLLIDWPSVAMWLWLWLRELRESLEMAVEDDGEEMVCRIAVCEVQ